MEDSNYNAVLCIIKVKLKFQNTMIYLGLCDSKLFYVSIVIFNEYSDFSWHSISINIFGTVKFAMEYSVIPSDSYKKQNFL